jgi:hypothetical protein
MSETEADTTVPPAPAQPGDSMARSIESLLDLGLPKDPKYGPLIRPLARELLEQLAPADAAERMLSVQMIAAFSRSIFLARLANVQTHPKWFALYSRECNSAMTMFRRQLQTLTDLRRPRRTTFNAIRQANIAGQQIVVNDPVAQQAAADQAVESTRGTTGDGKSIQETAAALPSEQNRPRRPARQRAEQPPLAT